MLDDPTPQENPDNAATASTQDTPVAPPQPAEGVPTVSTTIGVGEGAQAAVDDAQAANTEAAAASVGGPDAAPEDVEAADWPKYYIVQPGDSLESIALQFYGDEARAAEILNLNSNVLGSDPGAVIVGAQLELAE